MPVFLQKRNRAKAVMAVASSDAPRGTTAKEKWKQGKALASLAATPTPKKGRKPTGPQLHEDDSSPLTDATPEHRKEGERKNKDTTASGRTAAMLAKFRDAKSISSAKIFENPDNMTEEQKGQLGALLSDIKRDAERERLMDSQIADILANPTFKRHTSHQAAARASGADGDSPFSDSSLSATPLASKRWESMRKLKGVAALTKSDSRPPPENGFQRAKPRRRSRFLGDSESDESDGDGIEDAPVVTLKSRLRAAARVAATVGVSQTGAEANTQGKYSVLISAEELALGAVRAGMLGGAGRQAAEVHAKKTRLLRYEPRYALAARPPSPVSPWSLEFCPVHR